MISLLTETWIEPTPTYQSNFVTDLLRLLFLDDWLTGHISLLFFNTFLLRHDGRHFSDGIFKHFFSSENVGFSIQISLKFVR